MRKKKRFNFSEMCKHTSSLFFHCFDSFRSFAIAQCIVSSHDNRELYEKFERTLCGSTALRA